MTGSNRPRRFHIPSPSTHVDRRVLRRCRSRRSRPSSASAGAWPPGRDGGGTRPPSPLQRPPRARRRVPAAPRARPGSSRADVRVRASTWPAVVVPSPNASARLGVAANVAERSLVLVAVPSEHRSASAIADSGNDDTASNWATSPACGRPTTPEPHAPRPAPTAPSRHLQRCWHGRRRCAPPARSPPWSPCGQPYGKGVTGLSGSIGPRKKSRRAATLSTSRSP